MKELKIQIPEGYEIDKEKSTFEKIVFKPIDNKPRSWEEYCVTYKGDYYFITPDSQIMRLWFNSGKNKLDVNLDKNTLPTKELAEAFLAMMQLMSLRQDWIHKWSLERGLTKDWEPDWKNDDDKKWCITFCNCKLRTDFFMRNAIPLSFPTKEMVIDFKNCFKDLLEQAKILL